MKWKVFFVSTAGFISILALHSWFSQVAPRINWSEALLTAAPIVLVCIALIMQSARWSKSLSVEECRRIARIDGVFMLLAGMALTYLFVDGTAFTANWEAFLWLFLSVAVAVIVIAAFIVTSRYFLSALSEKEGARQLTE